MAPADVLTRLYDAFAAGNGAALQSLLGDTDWVEARGGPYGGRYHGLGDIAANAFGPIARDVSGFSAVPDEVVQVGEDRTLGLGFDRGTTPHGPLEIRFDLLATTEGERITHFEQLTDTHEWRQAVTA